MTVTKELISLLGSVFPGGDVTSKCRFLRYLKFIINQTFKDDMSNSSILYKTTVKQSTIFFSETFQSQVSKIQDL